MRLHAPCLGLCILVLSACGGPREAPRVELAVFADGSGVTPVETDLGYRVELTEARALVQDITFAIAGEAHTASLWRTLSGFVLPVAHAHPGHFQEGDVTGELRGRFVLDWLPASDEDLGRATLLAGTYQSANFTIGRAEAEDLVEAGDPLVGHTAVLCGRATKGESTVDFTATIISPEGRELLGAPFELEVREDSGERLGLRLLTRDPLEGDTLFDGIDFAALDDDGDGHVLLAPSNVDEASEDAYNLLRRTFQTHDHFDVRASSK